MKPLPIATVVLLVASVALCPGCRDAPRDQDKYHEPLRSGTYSFDVYVDAGAIHAVLADYESGSRSPELSYRRSDDGGESWSEPVRVDTDGAPAYLPYRGIDPQIAAHEETLVVVWTTAGEDVFGYGTGPLATAISRDGGASWRRGPNPSDDGLETAHEFIDVATDPEGRFHLVWIDDRDDEDGIRRGLRYARSTDAGTRWSENETIDRHICGCCWTHVRAEGGALYLLFRDEHPDPSDMKLAYSPDGGAHWEERSTVGRFEWMQQGCPHTTGGLAVTPTGLRAVVQTGKEGAAGIYYLRSGNQGRDWSPALRLAGEEGHYPDLAARAGTGFDEVAAVWQEQRGARTVVLGSLSRDGGSSWSSPRQLSPADGGEGASAGYPRVVATSGAFQVFWTESLDGKHYRFSGSSLTPVP